MVRCAVLQRHHDYYMGKAWNWKLRALHLEKLLIAKKVPVPERDKPEADDEQEDGDSRASLVAEVEKPDAAVAAEGEQCSTNAHP